MDDRVSRAVERYELATFGGDPSELDLADRDLDAAEADLAVARGRIAHARFFVNRVEDPGELADFERAARLYRGLGEVEGEALASFWVGCAHQVVRRDGESALPALRHAYETGGNLTRSYAARHLGFHALETQDLERAGACLRSRYSRGGPTAAQRRSRPPCSPSPNSAPWPGGPRSQSSSSPRLTRRLSRRERWASCGGSPPPARN